MRCKKSSELQTAISKDFFKKKKKKTAPADLQLKANPFHSERKTYTYVDLKDYNVKISPLLKLSATLNLGVPTPIMISGGRQIIFRKI